MKKFKTVFIGILSSLLLASCASVSKMDFSADMGTPEDSVIFYGIIASDSFTSFSQMDTRFDPDYQEFKVKNFMQVENIIVSNPVRPGSTYAVNRSKGESGTTQVGVMWNSTFPMNLKSVQIKMPEEPGLYYIGYINGELITRQSELIEFKTMFMPSVSSTKIKVLEQAKQKYKDTVWEPVIDSEISKLKEEK